MPFWFGRASLVSASFSAAARLGRRVAKTSVASGYLALSFSARSKSRGSNRPSLYGVAVDAEARHTILRRNSASQSNDDGFDVEGSTTKVTKNSAVRNRDLGIEAVRGVIDGSGNIAHHNGDPRQCTHIACK